MSGHTFRFRWAVQDLEGFFGESNSPLAVKGVTCREEIRKGCECKKINFAS